MGCVHFGTLGLWDQPVARDRDAGNAGGVLTETLLPGLAVKSTVPG